MGRKMILLVLLVADLCAVGVDADDVGTFRGIDIGLDTEMPSSSEPISDRMKWTRIQHKIESLEIAHVGLAVTDSEVDGEYARRIALIQFPDDAATKVEMVGKTMREALLKWRANPEQDQTIYDSLLTPLGVSLAAWESLKETNATSDSKGRKAGKDLIRNELLRKRLAEYVSGEAMTPEGDAWDAFICDSTSRSEADDTATRRFAFTQQRMATVLDLWLARLVQNRDLQITSEDYRAAIESRAIAILSIHANE